MGETKLFLKKGTDNIRSAGLRAPKSLYYNVYHAKFILNDRYVIA